LNAANALKDSGAKILGMMGLFTYGFSNAEEEFRKAKIKLQTLCDYQNLLSEALKIGTINKMQLESLKTWRENPSTWSPENL
jgi:orotate phosphoribosyltransferase